MQRYHYVLYYWGKILTEVLAVSEQEARELALQNYERCPGIHPDHLTPGEYRLALQNTHDIRRYEKAVTLCALCGAEHHRSGDPKRETVLVGYARREGVELKASYSEHLHPDCRGAVQKEVNLERFIRR